MKESKYLSLAPGAKTWCVTLIWRKYKINVPIADWSLFSSSRINFWMSWSNWIGRNRKNISFQPKFLSVWSKVVILRGSITKWICIGGKCTEIRILEKFSLKRRGQRQRKKGLWSSWCKNFKTTTKKTVNHTRSPWFCTPKVGREYKWKNSSRWWSIPSTANTKIVEECTQKTRCVLLAMRGRSCPIALLLLNFSPFIEGNEMISLINYV